MAKKDNKRRMRPGTIGYEYWMLDGRWLTPMELAVECDPPCHPHTIRSRLAKHTPEEAISFPGRSQTPSNAALPRGTVRSSQRKTWCHKQGADEPGLVRCCKYWRCWLPRDREHNLTICTTYEVDKSTLYK